MNEIEQKEIEEIAKILNECCNFYDKNGKHLGNKCNSHDCEYWCGTNHLCCSYNKKEATVLYNAGYRNCKDKVVLSKEEYANLQGKVWANFFKEAEILQLKEELAQARKETAREILAKLQGYYHQPSDTIILDVDDFYKLAKQYGVEVEE